MTVRDRLDRPLRDLRISVTDRCNLRCTYCMPREIYGHSYRYLPKPDLLTFEEITRLTAIFSCLGVQKIRLTGGEPLLRRDLAELVGMIRNIQGINDLALTTNGLLLRRHAAALREGGLDRVTVSLDSLDQDIFSALSDAAGTVEEVMSGIEAARACGLEPVKINAVIRRGVNEGQIVPLVRRFAQPGYVLRFIEFMDVGSTNHWKLEEVVSGQEILARVGEHFSVNSLEPKRRSDVARRFQIDDGAGEIGIISSVSAPFCGNCVRARLTADGKLFTCLFGGEGLDFRTPIRSGASDAELEDLVRNVWSKREDRYSELRKSLDTASPERVEMSRIGG